MVFDPSQWRINCESLCGANQYVEDVGNPNWRSIKARLENLENGINRPLSQEDTTWYVDKDTGSDSNPGTQAEPFENLEKALDLLQSFTWVHNCVIKWRGAQSLNWDYATIIRVEKGKNIIIDGGDELNVIAAAVVADISGQIDGNWREIGRAGLGLVVNYAKGKMLKIGNLGGVPGPLTGQKSTIVGNTADTYRVAEPFTADPLNYEFEVVMPASTLTVNDGAGPADPDHFLKQAYGGVWLTSGYGTVFLQRCTFEGNSPVNVNNKDKCIFRLASCCINKPTLPSFNNIWRISFQFSDSLYGFYSDVVDPDDAEGNTFLPQDKCGLGIVGGDGSLFNLYFDCFSEWSGGVFDINGSFLNRISLEGSAGVSLRANRYSHIDAFESGNINSDSVGIQENCSFGGLIVFDGGGPGWYEGMLVVDSSATIGVNVYFRDCLDGISGRRSKIRFDGSNINGVNVGRFGVNVIDTSAIYYGPAAVVALTGPAGDLSLDGLVAVPGGHAGIIAGTPVRDIVTACVARNQNLFSI
jgi:hypothetical protein